jgi:hypothetical protein
MVTSVVVRGVEKSKTSASISSAVSIYRVVRYCVTSAQLVSGPQGVEE